MTMQLAERTVLDNSPDCAAYLWEGEANGVRARTVVPDPDLQMFIIGEVRNLPDTWVSVRVAKLIDADGKVYAVQSQGWYY